MPTTSTLLEIQDTWISTSVHCKSATFLGFHDVALTLTLILTLKFWIFRNGTGDKCVLENGVGFLAFSSDSGTQGMGFRARIVVEDAVNRTIDSAHFFNSPEGFFQYPPVPGEQEYYFNNERKLMIFQLTHDNYLELPWMYLSPNDYLHFFSIYPFHDRLEAKHEEP